MNTPTGTIEAVQRNSIRHLWIELTNRCNLECVHCYADSGPGRTDATPLSFEEYQKVIRDAFLAGCRSIQFIGGEPTINPLLEKLVEFASAEGYEAIEIFSNLTKVSDSLLACAKGTRATFATSIYSDLPSVHDGITRAPGSHAKTTGNVRRISAAGVAVRVGVILMPENEGRGSETQEFVRRLGATSVGTDRARQIGRIQSDGGVSADELCGHCWEDTVCVDPDGRASPCIMSKRWRIGDVRSASLTELVATDRVQAVREALAREYQAKAGSPSAGCSPKDTCGPKACKPQVGGPSGCFPKKVCAPRIFGG